MWHHGGCDDARCDHWAVRARQAGPHAGQGADMCAALMYAMTAVEAEPLRESAHREVTAVHLAEGNTAEALRHFVTYRHRLRDQVGLPPSAEYRRLLEPRVGRPPPIGRG